MKRILLMLLILVLLFAGCKPAEEPQDDENKVYQGDFETYIAGGSNGDPTPSEIKDPWGFPGDELAPKERTVEVFGVQYACRHTYPEIEYYNSYVTEYYITEEKIGVGINRANGSIVLFDRQTSLEHDDELLLLPDVENAREYAIEMATEIASQWIDIENYEQMVNEAKASRTIENTECNWTNYKVTFFKKVNGIKTSDYMTVCVCSRGVLRYVRVGDIGAFADYENEDCTPENVEKSIAATMEMVEKEKGREEQAYEIVEHVLAITPDGEYVVSTTLSVTYRDAKTKKNYESRIRMITKFGESATE